MNLSSRRGTRERNWIRKDARLALYLRDGLRCVYCSKGIETGPLTLDHIVPHSAGGGNEPTNLITSCRSCNCSRQDKTIQAFAGELKARQIRKHVESVDVKPLRKVAKALLARLPWEKAIETASKAA